MTKTKEPQFRLASDLVLPARAVTEKIAFIGRTGSGKSFAAQKLAEEMLGAGAQIVVLDPGGDWYGLRVKVDGSPSGFDLPVIGGLHGDLPLEPGTGKLLADLVVDRGISCVLDVSLLRKNQRKDFATDFAEQLFHRSKRYKSPIHLFLEEAQVFVPQRTDHGEARMLGAFEDLVKLGRKFGIGTTLISQRPQSVNKDALNQIELLVCMQLNGPQERKAIEAWVHDKGVTEDLIEDLPKLQVGEAVVWSPSWLQIFKRVKIEKKKTLDAGGTPLLGAKQVQPRELAPIDLEEVRKAMSEVVKRQEENDPEKLKRRIRELERGQSKTAALPDQPRIKELERELATSNNERASLRRALIAAADKAEGLVSNLRGLLDSTPAPAARVAAPLAKKAAPTPRARPVEDTGSQGGIVAGARRMLQVLACWSPQPLTKDQLATLAGMSQSGTFSTYLGRLRSAGYVEDDREGLAATAAGIQFLGEDIPPAPSSTEELVDLFASKLGGAGAARMLRELVEQYPAGLSKEELATRCGMTNSGTFSTYLGRIRRNGLLDDRERGVLKASQSLFMSTPSLKRSGA